MTSSSTLTPPPLQAEIPTSYTHEEGIGDTWSFALFNTAAMTALLTGTALGLYLLNIATALLMVTVYTLQARKRKEVRRTLPTGYAWASSTVFMVGVLSLIFPLYDSPDSLSWRLPLLAFITLIYFRFLAPSFHPIQDPQ